MDDKVGGAVVGGECVSAVVVFDIPAVSRAESFFCRSCGNQDLGATTQVKPFIYRDRAFGGQLQVSETDSVQIRIVDVAFVVKRERESQFQVIQDLQKLVLCESTTQCPKKKTALPNTDGKTARGL